jgi:hypothetical protein
MQVVDYLVQTTASTLPAAPPTSTSTAALNVAADRSTVTAAAKPVYLLSTRHIVHTWAKYGALLPVFKGTADVPLLILQAVQSLFEEFMLWIVTAFAGVNPETVVRGLGGTHDRFFQARSDL